MAIAHLLNQAGQIENKSSSATDRDGNYSFGVARDVRMRFEKTTKVIATVERQREPIDGEVWLDASQTIDVGDRITYLGQKYKVMRCSPITLGNGQTHHTECLVQLWSFGA